MESKIRNRRTSPAVIATYEREIVTLYANGISSVKIGAQLHISSAAVLCMLARLGIPRRSTNCAEYALRGPAHPMWGRHHTAEAKAKVSAANRARGGERSMSSSGYWLVQSPGHPFANSNGHMPEHRLTMERILNRYLLPSEVVHHINRIKTDNRPSNLKLLDSTDAHYREHSVWEQCREKVEPVIRGMTPVAAARVFGTHRGTMCHLFDRWGIPRPRRK